MIFFIAINMPQRTYGPYAPNAQVVDKLRYNETGGVIYPTHEEIFGSEADDRDAGWVVSYIRKDILKNDTWIRGYSCVDHGVFDEQVGPIYFVTSTNYKQPHPDGLESYWSCEHVDWVERDENFDDEIATPTVAPPAVADAIKRVAPPVVADAIKRFASLAVADNTDANPSKCERCGLDKRLPGPLCSRCKFTPAA
jgi:hypothetical protein